MPRIMLRQEMKGAKWHNATDVKNGFIESAERYLLSHLKTYEKNGIALFAVTDINNLHGLKLKLKKTT